jgi:outer membrane protein insertion porin family
LHKKIILSLGLSSYLLYADSFAQIKFDGLTQISFNVAKEIINLKDQNNYTTKEIDRSIKELYKYGYFTDIWVTNDNNILTYHFKEKPFIAKLEMSGYKTREDEQKLLYEAMGLKKGTMFTQKKIKKAKTILLLALEQEGYINSTVEVTIHKLNDTSIVVSFEVNKGEPIIIDKITYNGAKALDVDDFESVVGNKEEDCCFTWFFGRNDGEMQFEQLQYDSLRIKDLYLQNGYLDAKVSAAFSKIDFNINKASIEYNINEGAQYKINNVIIYLNDKILNVDTLYPELKLEKGDIFNISKLRKDQAYIKTQVANKGYAFAKVNFDIKKNKKTNTVDLVYNVIEGDKVYINDVIVSGNSRTLDRVIRRNVYLAPGDLFSLTDFKDSKNALRRTGFFEKVELKQKRISKDKMDLVVEVSEAPTGSLVFGGGYGSYDGWMLNAAISDNNVFGSGLNTSFKVDYSSKSTSYNISVSNPAIRDSKYSGSVNVHQNKSTITNTDTTIGDKTTTQKGFGLGIGRGLNRHTRVGANYAYDTEDVTYTIDTASNSIYTTSSITPYINFNNTDDYLLPRTGVIAGTSLKYAGVGGDAKYMLSSTYFKYFYSLEDLTDKDIIFRYKNNLKMLEDKGNIPDGTTFYLGGVSSVRGYTSYAFQPEDTDRPFTRYFTNTVELSFPLIPSAKMRWELFYDMGMVGENKFNQIQRSGNGVAISWISPVGPIQFIFSRAVDAQEGDKTSNFEFSLGSKF